MLRGEEIEEPQNFLQQMIMDIKKSMEERKTVVDALEQQQAHIVQELDTFNQPKDSILRE